MNYTINDKNEKPLDHEPINGGYTAIFRTVACVGDSLSSGEFEVIHDDGTKTYHDMYEYSWGQFISRAAGCKVYNFSRGGMTAKWYLDTFADENGFWDKDKAAQAYIIALGVNDVLNKNKEIGSVADIDLNDYNNNKDTFAGLYGKIIQKYKEIQPKAKFFLVTFPYSPDRTAEKDDQAQKVRQLLLDMANLFEYTYVIDLYEYAPKYDQDFHDAMFMFGHLNPAGYVFTAKMIMSYIDYIVRHNFKDFYQVGLIGTDLYMDKLDEKE